MAAKITIFSLWNEKETTGFFKLSSLNNRNFAIFAALKS
jgi:hypothetical protein